MPQTRRQSIADVLRTRPMTVMEIARQFGASVKTILADLEHIRRTSKGSARFVIRQAECSSCGFLFRKRTKLDAPSRCPQCRRETIREPEFHISG